MRAFPSILSAFSWGFRCIFLGLTVLLAPFFVPAAVALEECKCEDLAAIQTELAIALLLKQRFEIKARQLAEKYGENPNLSQSEQAFREFEAFVKGEGEGSAGHGLRAVAADVPSRVPFTPRGGKQREIFENNQKAGIGIPSGRRWVDDRSVVNHEERRRIEQEWKRAGKDLCSPEDPGKMEGNINAGAKCAGIARAFTLRSVGMSKVNFQMTPWDGGTRGAYTYQGTGGGARFVGDGRYILAIGENDGRITLFSDCEAHVIGRKVKDTGMGTFKLTPLQETCE
jgi:hypothetical protein